MTTDDNKSKEQLIREIEKLRRQAEEALVSSEAQLARSQEIAHLGSWQFDLGCNKLIWSDEVYRIFGLAPKEFEVTYEAFLQRVHPDDRAKVDAAYIGSIRENRDTYEIEHRIVRNATGEIRFVHEKCEHVRDASGRIVRSIGMVHDITDRKNYEEALKKSEEQKRLALEAALLGTWEFNPRTRELFLDKRSREIFGVSTTKLLDLHTFVERIHPEDRSQVREHIRNVLTSPGSGLNVVYRIVRADGEQRWISVNGKADTAEETKQVLRVVGTYMDITERIKIEQALHEAVQRYELVLAGAEAAIWDLDVPNCRLVCSHRWEEMRGYAEHEVSDVLKEWKAGIHPDDVQRVMTSIQDHLDGKTPLYAEEYRVRRKDGSWMWVADRGLARRDAQGRAVQMAGSETDITERKRAERDLRESEHRYRSLFQSMEAFAFMEPIFGADGDIVDFRYLEVNDAGARIRGAAPDAIPGKSIREVLPNIDPYWITAYSRVALSGQPMLFERQNHNGRWYRTYVYCPQKGKIASLLIDITDRVRAEQALQELTEELEQRVAERTTLAESRAKQLQRLAVELIESEERERHRIASLLHEDLQQLLAAARFILQSKRPADNETSEVERLLEESISKSRHLSHELSPPVLHRSGLAAALEWLCLHMRDQFGLDVQLETDSARPVDSAPLRVFLFRASQELLFNVVKHAGAKTAHIKVACSGNEVIVTVSDAGAGFDTSLLKTHRPKAGLGLISLIERASFIGGSLSIDSTPGRGSKLTLRVPAKMEANLHQTFPAMKTTDRFDTSAEEVPSDSGIRVLFADDHKVMRQGLIRLVLGKPNISVVGEAANGREALMLARSQKPNVIVMDVSMPVMDGIEATRRIKTEMPGVHVLGLSMHEDEHVSAAMREAGAEAFLSKAASSSELLNAIYELAGQGPDAIPGSNAAKATQLRLPL